MEGINWSQTFFIASYSKLTNLLWNDACHRHTFFLIPHTRKEASSRLPHPPLVHQLPVLCEINHHQHRLPTLVFGDVGKHESTPHHVSCLTHCVWWGIMGHVMAVDTQGSVISVEAYGEIYWYYMSLVIMTTDKIHPQYNTDLGAIWESALYQTLLTSYLLTWPYYE